MFLERLSMSVVSSAWTPAAALRTGEEALHAEASTGPLRRREMEPCSGHKAAWEASEGMTHRRKATNSKYQKLSHKNTYL